MDIFTLIGLSILLVFLWESGIIGMFILACVLVFLWEKFNAIILTVVVLSALVLILKYVFQVLGYMFIQGCTKNKNPKNAKEQELEENLNKIREWSRRNKC
ncbi:TPA: hypothetical protein CPT94_06695 [Candidatus Gastranaerophilales bacterium HUM_22]|nr:MAG TPA: hypothetical protein CPT94_06695 [Candidatus Gastranaerophilales bacterium HUM_22]